MILIVFGPQIPIIWVLGRSGNTSTLKAERYVLARPAESSVNDISQQGGARGKLCHPIKDTLSDERGTAFVFSCTHIACAVVGLRRTLHETAA